MIVTAKGFYAEEVKIEKTNTGTERFELVFSIDDDSFVAWYLVSFFLKVIEGDVESSLDVFAVVVVVRLSIENQDGVITDEWEKVFFGDEGDLRLIDEITRVALRDGWVAFL